MVTYLDPQPPVTFSGSGCSSYSILLVAQGNPPFQWLDSAGNIVFIGDSFYVPPSLSSTTYYAREGNQGPIEYIGPANSNIGTGDYHNTGYFGRTMIEADAPLKIKSAWVDTDSPGTRAFYLLNSGGDTLQKVSFDVPFTGSGRVDINLTIDDPGAYMIATFSDGLYRNNSGPSYPYSIQGLMSITGSSAGANYYYYFYDLEVQSLGCSSDSVPVTAVVTDTIDFITTNLSVQFNDLSPNAGTWLWDFGDGNTSIYQNPMHTYAAEGDYLVSLTTDNGCTISYMVNVTSIGVEELIGFEMTVYPNPSTGIVNVEFSEGLTESAEITVITMDGIEIRRDELEKGSDSITLDLSDLAEGIYQIIVTSETGILRERVIRISE